MTAAKAMPHSVFTRPWPRLLFRLPAPCGLLGCSAWQAAPLLPLAVMCQMRRGLRLPSRSPVPLATALCAPPSAGAKAAAPMSTAAPLAAGAHRLLVKTVVLMARVLLPPLAVQVISSLRGEARSFARQPSRPVAAEGLRSGLCQGVLVHGAAPWESRGPAEDGRRCARLAAVLMLVILSVVRDAASSARSWPASCAKGITRCQRMTCKSFAPPCCATQKLIPYMRTAPDALPLPCESC